jgi:hypothetical protein
MEDIKKFRIESIDLFNWISYSHWTSTITISLIICIFFICN